MKRLSPMMQPSRLSLIVLSLASLIAASTSSGLALLIGISSWLVLLISSAVISLLRPWLRKEASLARADSTLTLCFIALLVASVVSLLSLVIQVSRYEAMTLAGIWLPLIASNGLIYMHLVSAWDASAKVLLCSAWVRGAQFTVVMLLLALVRELLGTGSILTNMHVFFSTFSASGIIVISNYPRLKLFALPTGGLLVLGLSLALIQWMQLRRLVVAKTVLPSEEKRVRVTGRIS
ncbi:hypothetical protein E3V39_09085 [Gammaproteobacteria bacterium LSUCC0112]|nr:hypothetical protein E3V39_09085 [Gammaproteobacteria bacterium LSUCC0112]